MLHDEMLTIEDLARFLKLKRQTIYKWAQLGKLPGAKFGKEWRFRRSAIEKWIDQCMGTAVATGSNGKRPAREAAPGATSGKGARRKKAGSGAARGRAAGSKVSDGSPSGKRKSSAERN